MPQAADMTGKAALVTGAASGLGRATALALARAGADLCLVDIKDAALRETASLIADMGRSARIHVTDLSLAENCAPLVAACVEAYGRLDALCNVAGIIIFSHTPEMALADWERTMAINLRAPFLLCQAAIPHLLKTEGAIVNVSSTAANIGEAYVAAYCASKGGLNQMTRALAMEYIDTPIRINALAPGGMMTSIGENIRMPPNADRSLIQRYSGRRGLCEVDQVADMIAYLASPAAHAFHGSCVVMDRGISAG